VVERLGAAGGLGDDVDALLLEQVAQAGAEEIVVVDEEDANRVRPCLLPGCCLVQRCPPRLRQSAEFTSGS
jgi:hypothetical protein